MSFANILSEPTAPRPAPKTSPPRPEIIHKPLHSIESPTQDNLKAETRPDVDVKMDIDEPSISPPKPPLSAPVSPSTVAKVDGASQIDNHMVKELPPRRSLTEKEYNRVHKILERIEAEESSDVDDSGFLEELKEWEQRREKRTLDNENIEMGKRKVHLPAQVVMF